MNALGQILEHELATSFEVKNEDSLHRYITILTENLVQQDKNEREHAEFREAIIRIDTRIEEGFKRMDERFKAVDKRFEAVDKRFEAVDKRFDDVNKRFSMMFTFMSLGFIILATLMSVYQFL